jgi:hypothetical protein
MKKPRAKDARNYPLLHISPHSFLYNAFISQSLPVPAALPRCAPGSERWRLHRPCMLFMAAVLMILKIGELGHP